MKRPTTITSADGKLGVLLVGLGAVSTTIIAGVLAIRKGPRQADRRRSPRWAPSASASAPMAATPLIKDFVPLAGLDDIVFGGWDIFDDDCYSAATTAGVLESRLLDQIKPRAGEHQADAGGVRPDTTSSGSTDPNVKKGKNKRDLAEQVRRRHPQASRASTSCDRLVMIWCGSTEVFMKESAAHQTLDSLRASALDTSDRLDSVQHDLRLRGAQRRHAVRERRAEPDRRHSGAAGARREERRRRSPATTSRPGRR